MDLYLASTWVLPVLIAVTFHEAAHGWVAWRLGDDTAMRAGRVSFNPIRHIDPMGTIILPGLLIALRAPFLFGWAKPVPVSVSRLGSPKRDMALVAAAGPGINFALAVLAMLALGMLADVPVGQDNAADWIARNFANAVLINIMLAVFNLVPIPPLDGGRILVGILPESLARPLAKLERVGMLIVISVFFLIPFAAAELGFEADYAARALYQVATWVLEGMAGLLGPAMDGR